MAITATALADLRFGLRFAAKRYRQFAEVHRPRANADLFLSLADERSNDANEVDEAAASARLAHAQPTIDDDTAGSLLGLGSGQTFSATSAAYRVQRTENTLGRMAAQLESLADEGLVRAALDRVRSNIENRRDAVREARHRARRSMGLILGAAAHGEATESVRGGQVIVWFGTNRRKNGAGNFSGERANGVSYGQCLVFVPKDRAVGSLGGRSAAGAMIG
jgi:hypothetical protein